MPSHNPHPQTFVLNFMTKAQTVIHSSSPSCGKLDSRGDHPGHTIHTARSIFGKTNSNNTTNNTTTMGGMPSIFTSMLLSKLLRVTQDMYLTTKARSRSTKFTSRKFLTPKVLLYVPSHLNTTAKSLCPSSPSPLFSSEKPLPTFLFASND